MEKVLIIQWGMNEVITNGGRHYFPHNEEHREDLERVLRRIFESGKYARSMEFKDLMEGR